MKNILLLLIIFITVKNGIPCSCEYYEADFYKNVYKDGFNCIAVFDTFETVTLEKIGEFNIQIGYFILTDAINSGKFQIGDTIKVLGSSGANCGEQMYIFDKGDTLALALRNNYINEFLKDTFYMEGICGKHFLKIKNGMNDGLTIPEIIEKVNTIIASSDVLNNRYVPLIYPIPMQDYLRIDHSSTIQQVDVLDIKGIKLFSVFPMERNTRIDTGKLREGIYIIVVKTQDNVYRNTIIKRN